METEIQWKVFGAAQVRIEPKIGSVPAEGDVTVRLGQEARFVIFAESYFGVTATAAFSVRLLKATALAIDSAARKVAATSLAVQKHTALGNGRVTALGTSGTDLKRSSNGSLRPDEWHEFH
jgi:hypothetical protein